MTRGTLLLLAYIESQQATRKRVPPRPSQLANRAMGVLEEHPIQVFSQSGEEKAARGGETSDLLANRHPACCTAGPLRQSRGVQAPSVRAAALPAGRAGKCGSPEQRPWGRHALLHGMASPGA